MKKKEEIPIKIPYELAGKLSKRIKEVGFKSITEYIVYVLEQTLKSDEENIQEYDQDDEKTVRARLKELGYL